MLRDAWWRIAGKRETVDCMLQSCRRGTSSTTISFFGGGTGGAGTVVMLPAKDKGDLVVTSVTSELSNRALMFRPDGRVIRRGFGGLYSCKVLSYDVCSTSFGSGRVDQVAFTAVNDIGDRPRLFTRFGGVVISRYRLIGPVRKVCGSFFSTIGYGILKLATAPCHLDSDHSFNSVLGFVAQAGPRIFSRIVCRMRMSALLSVNCLSGIGCCPVGPAK